MGPLFQLCQDFVPLPVDVGAQTTGPSSFMDLPAGASVGVVVCVLFLSSPCLCCRPFSRGAEDDRLGMRVGSDRVLVWGLGQGVPQSQAVSPLAPARVSLVSLLPNRNDLSSLDLGRGMEWYIGAF